MTQPVWPDQLFGSSAASFSGNCGSPALPKMPSTKSRLQTRPPGTMKRVSMVFAGPRPGTAGTTSGRSISETKQAAGFGWFAVNGSFMSSTGGWKANSTSRA